ncbi:MAG: ABC transporter permease, partial [Saprospiraceae bacterium]
MIRNYFKIAVRNLLKNKAFSAINIIGLSVSMGVCLLIILMIADQYSLDSYNNNKSNVYRITSLAKMQDGAMIHFAPAPFNLVERLQQESSAVDKVAVARRFSLPVNADGESLQLAGFHANPDFLAVFDKKLTAGNPITALTEPNTIVLTAKTAAKLFNQENPVGKVLAMEDSEGKVIGNLTVTGVLEDKAERSHLNYDALISFSSIDKDTKDRISDWLNVYECWVYALLKPQADITLLKSTLNQIAKTECQKPDVFPQLTLETQALRSINPSDQQLANEPGPTMPSWVMYFFSGLALIIITLACFNYANLSLARSLKRAKEVGIRKVTGAFRHQIIGQFLTESVVMALLALGGALLLLKFLIPAFYSLDAETRQIFNLEAKGFIYIWFFIFAITIGLLAGLSPALLLSRFRPVQTLRKLANVKIFSQLNVRKGLIVTQFAVSLIFIITTVTMNRQFHHMMNVDLGFNKDNIIHVELQNQSYSIYQQAISQHKDVKSVSASSIIPATNGLSGVHARKSGSADSVYLAYVSVDPNYIPNMELKLLAGRNFESVDSADNERFVILNEKAIKDFKLGTPQEAIGQSITVEDRNLEVIGVVNDFVIMSVNEPMRAIALRNYAEFYTYVNVRVSGYETQETLQALEAAWKSLGTRRPFRYQFYDEALANANLGMIITMKVVGFAGFLAILIACMGLLGMVMYTTETRL